MNRKLRTVTEQKLPLTYALLRKLVRNYYLSSAKRNLTANLDSEIALWGFGAPQIKKKSCAIYALHWLNAGGAEEVAIASLVDFVKKYKEQIFVTLDFASDNILLSKLPENISIIDLSTERGTKKLNEIITKFKIDFVSIHHSAKIYDELSHIRWNSPDVFVEDTLHIIESGTGGFVHHSILHRSKINQTHVISQELVKYIKQFNFVLCPPDLKLGYLIPKYWTPNAQCQSFKNTKRINIGFVGRLETQKQPELFLKLCKKIARRFDNVQFHVYGNGTKKSELISLARHYNLNAVFHGHIDEKEEIYKDLDLILFTSENEGIPLVIFEAIAKGKLVISTDVGAVNEILPKNLIFKLHSFFFYNSIVRRIERLRYDKKYRDYSWHSIINKSAIIRELSWKK